MKKNNDANNINQCVDECPDKYIEGDNNFCKKCILQINFITQFRL